MPFVRNEVGFAGWELRGQVMPHIGRDDSIRLTVPQVKRDLDFFETEAPRLDVAHAVRKRSFNTWPKRLAHSRVLLAALLKGAYRIASLRGVNVIAPRDVHPRTESGST